jgi:hypothetical protein
MHGGTLGFLQWLKEQSLRLSSEELVFFAHWITPEIRPKRFDTRFFLVEVPSDVEVQPDGQEVFEHLWIRPREGVRLRKGDPLKLMTPTLRNLELLSKFSTTAEAVAALREAEVPTILSKPQLTADGNERFLHPGDKGYDAL